MAEWLRTLNFSVLNCSSSHRCGFQPGLAHTSDKPSSACGGQVFFLGDLPFLSHLTIGSAQNK